MRLTNRGRSILWTPRPVPYGTCICSNVETIHSWTCHVYGPFGFRISLGTSILLPGKTVSLISVSVLYIQTRGNSSDYYLYTKYWIKVVGRGNDRQLWNVLSPFMNIHKNGIDYQVQVVIYSHGTCIYHKPPRSRICTKQPMGRFSFVVKQDAVVSTVSLHQNTVGLGTWCRRSEFLSFICWTLSM